MRAAQLLLAVCIYTGEAAGRPACELASARQLRPADSPTRAVRTGRPGAQRGGGALHSSQRAHSCARPVSVHAVMTGRRGQPWTHRPAPAAGELDTGIVVWVGQPLEVAEGLPGGWTRWTRPASLRAEAAGTPVSNPGPTGYAWN